MRNLAGGALLEWRAIHWAFALVLVSCSSSPTAVVDATPGDGGDVGPGDAAADADAGTTDPPHCAYQPAPAVEWIEPTIGAVWAGVGERTIDAPVGSPLGGYADRNRNLPGHVDPVDERESPLVGVFHPSVGVQTMPRARAVAIQAGESMVVIVKVDVGITSQRLLDDLSQRLGLPGQVIVSASHTHSGWAANHPAFAMGAAFDRFQPSAHAALLAAAEGAAQDALASLEPAAIGAGVFEGWDSDDAIFGDRRSENDDLLGPDGEPTGESKDERLTVLRVDRADGTALALIFSFPMHGTVAGPDSQLASTDGIGHIELEVAERIAPGALVMHLQSAAGDARPRGPRGLQECDPCVDFARMEALGELAASAIVSLHSEVPVSGTAELAMLTRTAPVGRFIEARDGELAYLPFMSGRTPDRVIWNDDGTIRSPIDEFNVRSGAALCGDTEPFLAGIGTIRGTEDLIPYASCLDVTRTAPIYGSLFETETPEVPFCGATRSTLSALRLSGVPLFVGHTAETELDQTLLFLAVPGEPVSQWTRVLRDRSPVGSDHTFIVGYAQGHMGYLLTAEDWLAGGFEASINVWGPIEGEYLLENALALAETVLSDAVPAPDDVERLVWTDPDVVDPIVEPTPGAGSIPTALPDHLLTLLGPIPSTALPSDTVRRAAESAVFVFEGADPLAGTPVVSIEREVGGVFEAIARASGTEVDSNGPEILLAHTPDPIAGGPRRHLYLARWQAVGDVGSRVEAARGVALGQYRFVVRGPGYEVESTPFAVTAEGALSVALSQSGGELRGTAGFDVVDGFRLLRLDGPSDGFVPAVGDLTLTVTSIATGDEERIEAMAVDAVGGFGPFTTGLDVSEGVTVVAVDRFENEGTGSWAP